MKICPNCKTQMSDNYNNCSVCGCDLSGVPKVDAVSYMHQQRNNNKQNTGKKVLSFIAIVAACIVGFIILFNISDKQAHELYDEAYAAIYDIDSTYISSSTQSIVNKAAKKTKSLFISGETREKLNDLSTTCNDFVILGKIENQMAQGNVSNNINTIIEELDSISSSNVKSSSRYKNVAPYVQAKKFKQEQKSWAESALKDLTVDSSWNRYSISYYKGLATLITNDESHVEIMIEDYDNNTHWLELGYNYDEVSSWDSSLGKLINNLKNNQSCVMVAAAVDYIGTYSIVSYNCKYQSN